MGSAEIRSDEIAAIDLFVVPMITFKLLFGLAILHHDRRQLIAAAVTAHRTAEWLVRQLSEAFFVGLGAAVSHP